MKTSFPENFSYEFFKNNRYKISECIQGNNNYTALCNNGFVRLFENSGRAYHIVQNELSHLTPDWKFHVSVKLSDIEVAWDIVAASFLRNNCKTSCKAVYTKEGNVKAGREITIYIYTHDEKFAENETAKDFNLSKDLEMSEKFWFNVISEIEAELENKGLKSNGTAVGDLRISKFVSLRNEAYIKKGNMENYPEDNDGWNAAGQNLPFTNDLFKLDLNYGIGFRNETIVTWTIFIALILSFLFKWMFQDDLLKV